VASLAEDYSHLDPIAVGISIAVCVGASLSMKGSSRFNSIATVVHFLMLAFIFVAGRRKRRREFYLLENDCFKYCFIYFFLHFAPIIKRKDLNLKK